VPTQNNRFLFDNKGVRNMEIEFIGPEKVVKAVAKKLDMVTITREEYEELQRDSEKLARLIAAGVDNWEGYSEA
jgi:hypothetical protein